MPEGLNYQHVDPGPPEDQALTYQGLLKDPATPRGLVPHLQRLAADDVSLDILQDPQAARSSESLLLEPLPPNPALEHSGGKHRLHGVGTGEEQAAMPRLGDMSADLHARSSTMFNGPPANYGASYFKPKEKANEVLRSGDYSEQELADYLHEARVLCNAFEDNALRRNDFSDGSRYEGVIKSLANVPLQKLQAVYRSPELSGDLRLMLESANWLDDVRDALEIVTVMHERRDVLELWDADSSAFDDPTFQELLMKRESMGAITSTLERRAYLWPEGTDPEVEIYNKRQWGERFLERVVGLPEQMRKELTFDAISRTNNPFTGMLSSERLASMLSRTANNTRALGMDRVKQLYEKAGITSIDYYESKQLALMSAVLDGDPAAIQHLQEGDTTVVFTNAKVDHNGAFRTVGKRFGTESNSTLFFEINQPGDFYRYMIMLNKRGIKPSTLIMSAHGNAGILPIGGANNGLQLLTNKGKKRLIDRLPGWNKPAKPASAEYDVSQARGFARVVRDMMQDSRGIDDNPEAIGRRRIIMDNCFSAQPVEVRRPGLRNAFRRITRKTTEESLAETVTKVADHPTLDVFGNEKSYQTQASEDGAGVEHYIDYIDHAGEVQQEVAPATQLRLDRKGNVMSRRVTQIPLRRIERMDDDEFEQELMAA